MEAMATPLDSAAHVRQLDLDGRRFAAMLEDAGIPGAVWSAHVQRLVDTSLPGWWGSPVGARAVQVACACIARVARDPRIGLRIAEKRLSRSLTLGDYLVRSAPTLREAFSVAQRFFDPRYDYISTTLTEHGPYAVIELTPLHGLTLHPVNVDYRIARFITSTRALLGDPHAAPHEVALSYPRPSSTQAYVDCFGRHVKLEFSAPRARIVFASEVLDAPSVHRDDFLHEMMMIEAEKLDLKLRQQRTVDGVSLRLHDVIANQLEAGKPSIARAARKLGLSERTLRRRLADEGESFRSVVDTVRSSLAQTYLEDGKLSADVLAERLGFDSAVSLRRAFRRWTGGSLREQRVQQRELASAP